MRMGCRWLTAILCGFLPLTAAGCVAGKRFLPGGVVSFAQDDSIHLRYRIDAGRRGVPLYLSRVAGREVSYRHITSSPFRGRSLGVLEIRYPHPAGKDGHALATVALSQRQFSARPMSSGPLRTISRWLPAKGEQRLAAAAFHEIWALDIPRSELERMLESIEPRDAASSADEAGSIMLTVQRSGESFERTTSPLPQLDALMHQVRSEGQLISYQAPAATPGAFDTTPPSLIAYARLNRKSPPSQTAGALADRATGPALGVFAPPDQDAWNPPTDRRQIARLPQVRGRASPAGTLVR